MKKNRIFRMIAVLVIAAFITNDLSSVPRLGAGVTVPQNLATQSAFDLMVTVDKDESEGDVGDGQRWKNGSNTTNQHHWHDKH